MSSLTRPSTLYSWTILHKVLTRLNDFDGAVSTLREALRVTHITPAGAGSTITSSLRYDLLFSKTAPNNCASFCF